MTEVPGSEPPNDDGSVPTAPYPRAYPAYPASNTTSDDELAEALAAQTAMYTGPITLPVVNSDPLFRPDPAELQPDIAPPVVPGVDDLASDEPGPAVPPLPVPLPPPVPEYVAPDEVASDPEPAPVVDGWAGAGLAAAAAPHPEDAAPVFEAFRSPAPGASAAPLPDEELSRTVEQEAAAGSTLDAILLLENELRRRQGLPPVVAADEPPAEVGAVLGGGDWDSAAFAAAPPPAPASAEAPPAPSSPPGWIDAPDPEREGEVVAGTTAVPPDPDPATETAESSVSLEQAPPPVGDSVDDRAWLSAPPPSFVPPALVEPPSAPEFGTIDAGALTPAPVTDPGLAGFPPPVSLGDGVDVTMLPPPAADAGRLAPPPPVEAVVAAPTIVGPEAEVIDGPVRVGQDAPAPAPDADIDADADADAASIVPAPLSTATVVAVGVPVAPGAQGDPSPFSIETESIEPTARERRAGHAARLFWLWFAANSSIVMIAVGATLFTLGLSLRQVLVAIVAGVALSALPLGLGSLAGKWSGQPTMIVSRATFGLVGNLLPAVLAVLGRVLWGGVLLWLLAVTTPAVLAPGGDATVAAFVALAIGAVVAGVVSVLGYGLLHRVQRILGILSVVLVVATIVVTAPRVDIANALRTDDGEWLLAIGGIVTVFSVVGLAWAQSSSDLARYQNPAGSGAANMLWGSFGVMVPTLLILSWGAVLAASDPSLAEDLARAPLATLLGLVPSIVALPLLGATAFGLVGGAIVTMYSGGLAIVSLGARLRRPLATLIAAVLVAAVAAGLILLTSDTRDVLRDVATTLAVPVSAWTGIFASEMMIRLRRFHAPSLLAAGGVYPAVRWVNLIGLVVISAIGFGLTTAQFAGLQWEGYLFPLLGIGTGDPLAATDLGVLVALVLGLIVPLVSGIPAIRRQESDHEPGIAFPAATPLVD
ncbi:MAG: cytosine permease [Protaetiibacter sp.]